MGSGDAKQSLSFRVRPQTAEHLRRRARESGEPQGELAERLLEEGLRMDEHPRISFRTGPHGRYPALRGTRLSVAEIVAIIRDNDNSPAEAAVYLEIPLEDVDAVVRYYGEYQHEADEWAERAEACRRRVIEQAQRAQEPFS